LIPIKEFCSSLHSGQKKILKAFDNKEARFFMLNWARRHRKTTLALNILVKECLLNSNSVYLYIAPTYKQAKNIIWRDPNMLSKWIPEKYIKRKVEQELYIEFLNGSILQIKGADDPDSLRGIDCKGVVFDEWAVFKHSEVWNEIFRPIMAQDPRRWAMFIFTPKGQNHAFKMWNEVSNREDWYTLQLRATDSDIISKEELEKAREEMLPVLFNQEMLCSFIADEEFTLITSKMIEDLRVIKTISSEGRRIISIDPAFGGDEFVAYAFNDTKIVDHLYLYTRDPDKIYSQLTTFCMKNDTKELIIDTCGIGHGVGVKMVELEYNVIFFNGAEKPIDDRFANKRAESWWYTMEVINKVLCYYPKDIELIQQLSSVRFKPEGRNGKILLEKKEDTRKRISKSPDRADAFTMGIYGLRFIKNKLEKRMFYDKQSNNIKNKNRYGW